MKRLIEAEAESAAVKEFEARRGFPVTDYTWKDTQWGGELRLSRAMYFTGATKWAEQLAVAEEALEKIAASSPEIEATPLDVLNDTSQCSEAWELTARRRRKLATEAIERLKQMRQPGGEGLK
jgi:hypothetical protein